LYASAFFINAKSMIMKTDKYHKPKSSKSDNKAVLERMRAKNPALTMLITKLNLEPLKAEKI